MFSVVSKGTREPMGNPHRTQHAKHHEIQRKLAPLYSFQLFTFEIPSNYINNQVGYVQKLQTLAISNNNVIKKKKTCINTINTTENGHNLHLLNTNLHHREWNLHVRKPNEHYWNAIRFLSNREIILRDCDNFTPLPVIVVINKALRPWYRYRGVERDERPGVTAASTNKYSTFLSMLSVRLSDRLQIS